MSDGEKMSFVEENNSRTLDPAMVVKLENEVQSEDSPCCTGNTCNLSQCAQDLQKEIKVEKDDVNSTAENILSYTDNSHVVESNVIIKKEEDLGVFEEGDETLVDSNFSVFDDNQEDCKFDSKSLLADTVCNEAAGNFVWGVDEDGQTELFSLDTEELRSESQKCTASSESLSHEAAVSGRHSQTSAYAFSSEVESVCCSIKSEAHTRSEFQKSEHFYEGAQIKLENVSIVLEELYPKSQRGDTEVHIDSPNCQCIFCTRQFKLNKESGNIRKVMDDIKSTRFKTATASNSKLFSRSDRSVKLGKKSGLNSRLSHAKDQSFSCAYCLGKFKTKKTLKVHLKTCTSEKSLSCTHCPSKFNRKSELNSHLRIHNKGKPFLCTYCPAKFYQNDSLNAHLRIHTGMKPFLCALCPAKYSSRGGWKYHLKTHTDEKPHECTKCPSKFRCKSYLNRHLRRTHTDEKPFLCTHCPVRFKEGSSLKRHLNTHTGKKPFSCTFCTAKFKRSSHLKAHLMIHTGEKPFLCTYCLAKFRQSSGLKAHLRTHTGDKPFLCSQCPAKFSQKSGLKDHLLTHTNEKLFVCNHCPSKFNSRSSLKRHLRIHTNEKPFLCPYCPDKFNRSSSLKRHLKRHAVKKQFSCEHCAAEFKTKKGIKNHIFLHSKY